jgi:hypothetical protein
VRDRGVIHKPDPVEASLRFLHERQRAQRRAHDKLKSSLQTPTHPIYDEEGPADPIETEIAWRGDKTDPEYYRHGAWHPFGAGGEWAGCQFSNVVIPGDGSFTPFYFQSKDNGDFSSQTMFYASPYDNEIYTLNQSDHKLYINEPGVYEFKLGWFMVGDGAPITMALAMVAVPQLQNVMEGPVLGVAAGAAKAQGLYIRVQSYPEEVSYPQPIYFQALQNSGGNKRLNGQLSITRTSRTPHRGHAEPFPVALYPAGSQLPLS